MGYLVHIVRQTDYDNLEEESNISLEEWIEYVKSDTELELTSGHQLNLPVLLEPEEIENPTDQSPGYCEWMGHPRSDADTIPWLDFEFGSIITKYPDKHTIGKMIKIANTLNAKVRGDDGEYYDGTFFINGGYPVSE